MVQMEGRRLREASADFSNDSWRDYIITKKVKVKLPPALNIPSSRCSARVERELHVAVYEEDLSVSRFGPSVPWWTGWAKRTFLEFLLEREIANFAVVQPAVSHLSYTSNGLHKCLFWFQMRWRRWGHKLRYLKICRNFNKLVRSCLHDVSYLTQSFMGSASVHS
jgi:hypothetical protein